MPYHPTQDAVLDYAQGVLDGGFPPGVIMIDDRWSVDYGNWTFDRTRFPHPAEMTRRLHELGFSVMLWLVPFVSPDSENSRMAASKGWLIKGPDKQPVVRDWWNGYSTVLDLTHPEAVAWLRAALHDLIAIDGVDGFKFDAGDLRDYPPDDEAVAGNAAVDQCEAWARLARPRRPAPPRHPGCREDSPGPGRWRSSDGSVTAGATEIVLDVQLESMPYWRRIVS